MVHCAGAAAHDCDALFSLNFKQPTLPLLHQVLVLRLMTEGSVEKHVIEVAEEKKRFADSSITGAERLGRTESRKSGRTPFRDQQAWRWWQS